MSNGELLEKLSIVLNILNNVEVKGIQNLNNLAGAIAAIDEIGQKIAKGAKEVPDAKSENGGG